MPLNSKPQKGLVPVMQRIKDDNDTRSKQRKGVAEVAAAKAGQRADGKAWAGKMKDSATDGLKAGRRAKEDLNYHKAGRK